MPPRYSYEEHWTSSIIHLMLLQCYYLMLLLNIVYDNLQRIKFQILMFGLDVNAVKLDVQ